MGFRRHAPLAAVLLLLAAGFGYARAASGPVIPVPNPLVKVHTQSYDVVRDRVIPIGGVPVPIDVDEHKLLGLLYPDVDVSVGLIAAEELPGKPIVPTVEVNRDPTAILRNAPAPVMRIDMTIELKDAGNGLKNLATIDYGYQTTEGGRAPTKFRSKLIGPIAGGFVDPLEAVVDTPGYSGPLKINAGVLTDKLDATFGVQANPIPERIHFIEDPRDDGLDFHYDHAGPIPDIKLDATADLRDRPTGRTRHIDAHVERLPQTIDLHNTNTDEKTFVEYEATTPLAKPDLEANYRDTTGNGTIVTDANVKVAGLPAHMTGDLRYVPDGKGGRQIDSFAFDVLGGQQIDALDFLARNFVGDPGPIPEPNLGPDQFVAASTRQMPNATSRFRASGRLFGVRSLHFERQAGDNEQVDVTTDTGDGTESLRAIVDLDNRGPGGPPDPDDRRRMKVDTTITPLPRTIHANYDPARTGHSTTKLVYDSPTRVDVQADALIADNDATNGCGEVEVTCLSARIDKLPTHLEAELPDKTGTDFSLSHDGAGGERPDVRAQVDRTGLEATSRTYADIELLRVPPEVRGRMDVSTKDVVRAAEFHACDWNFGTGECDDAQQALGRVSFTVRDQPSRAGLPPRPDTTPNFVSLISRDPSFGIEGDERYEAAGRVDEVRNVAFHQRDRGDDGEADGTLGVRVDVGSEHTPFDVAVDTVGFATKEDDETVNLGDAASRVKVRVDELPTRFSACVREDDDAVPHVPPQPGDPDYDDLLLDCDRTDVLGRATGGLTSTPMSVAYNASGRTKVSANVFAQAPDVADENRQAVTELSATVDKVPRKLRTDVIPDIDPEPGIAGRKLEFAYDATDGDAATDDSVGTISFDLATRRANSLCEDPRVNRKATCVSGVLKDLPKTLTATYDPDETKGDITLKAAPPESGHPKLSINPEASVGPKFSLSSVKPGSSPIVVKARVEDIATELRGKLQQVNLDPEQEGMTGPLQARIDTCTDDADNDNTGGTDEKDEDCEPDMARFSFDACPTFAPENLANCDGIGKLEFSATNALVGDPIDQPPPAPSGITQDFTFMQVGEDFRATGKIKKFKQVALDKLDKNGNPSETTKLRAAFGNGDASDKIRAYVDRDTGTEAQKIDAIVAEAPQAVNLCLRSAVDPVDVRGSGFGFCEEAAADKTAVETRLDSPATTDKPDITVSTFELSKGGGAEVLRGIPGADPALKIDDLAEKIQVLAGAEDPAQHKRSDLVVEGRRLDGALDNVAGRVSFALQNFKSVLAGDFPRQSLTDATDPESDSANDDPSGKPNAGRNYLKIIGLGDKKLFKGSVPAIKRIKLDPNPCHPSDVRFPPEASFAPSFRPEYTCVTALAAQGRPLGLAVRTLDGAGEALSIDEGNLSEVPGGASGLQVTLTKSPDAAKPNKVCAAVADAAAGCRPPFVSLEAPRSSGQAAPVFRARLATGPLDLVRDLKDASPLDVLTRDRLDFEQAPSAWSIPGGRLKLGTRGDDVALRGSFNLALPEFLDIDPPTSYSCAHLEKDNVADCKDDRVSAEKHQGFEAKDIAIKLVGSNTGHGDRDLDTLGPNGRMALLVHDFDKSKQVILTGAPAATGPSGTTEYNGERGSFPPAGDHDKGLVIPGFLDAKVFLRDDYTAGDDDAKQQKFVQVDGRVNHPLSLTMRINEPDEYNRYGGNRDGDTVPGKQFTVRNAPCAGRPACGPYAGESFAKPSFRIRAEVLSARPKKKDDRCQGVDEWGAGFGFTACLILPQPDTRWMNVDLNQSVSGDPARTVEAVADSKDGNFDLKAFRNVNDKGTAAKFSPQAQLLLDPLEVGFRAGIGIGLVGAKTEMSMTSNLLVGAKGLANEQLRISQAGLAVRLKSEGGRSEIDTDMFGRFRTQVTEEAIFGLISDTDTDDTVPDHIHLAFLPCPDFDIPQNLIGHDGFAVEDDSEKLAGQLVPGPLQIGNDAAKVIAGVNAFLVPIFCLLPNTEDDDLVTASKPAPRWTEPNRLIDDINEQPGAGGGGGSVLGPATPTKVDRTISGTETLCGSVSAKTLRVPAGATLRVGAEGEQIPAPPPVDPRFKITCTGSVNLDVDRLVVEAGGTIDASAKRSSAGDGTPGSGTGGGAGHGGTGGASATGGGGAAYGSNSSLTDQTGSPGRGGSGVGGGNGGGAVRVSAADSVTVNGTIVADGASGADAGGADCARTSGGGGSGGSIQIAANKVNVGGLVRARGGNGGSGANGGGGGAGGKVRIDAVVRTGAAAVAGGGAGGAKGGSCGNGSNGGGGQILGQELGFAAGVTRDDTSPWVRGSVDLRLKGVKKGGGPLDIVYCRASLPLGTADPFNNPGLNPPDVNGDTEQLDDSSRCRTAHFDDPTSGGDTYETTVTWDNLGDSYYGFYAFAKETAFIFGDYQPIPPRVSTVKLGSDVTAPQVITVTRRNGVDGCADGAFCLDTTTGLMRLVAGDGNGSGLATSKCSVNGGAFSIECRPSDNVSVPLGGDGARTVDVEVTDLAGNTAKASDTGKEAKWFVDVKRPDAPVITLANAGTPKNGWYRARPAVTLTADDPAPSAGMAAGAIHVFVDEAERSCPTATPSGATATCAPAETNDFVPENGIHTFRASSVDRLGHPSLATTTQCAGSVDPDVCTMKVDSKPPTSRLFVGPTTPDGTSDWYTTRPFFAFAASDGAGGSGIDLALDPSKIRFKIDGGAYEDYVPARDDDGNPANDYRLTDGKHTVCYFAVDVAGNEETPHCSGVIKVDSAAPFVTAPSAPANPNGTNGFFTVTPTASPTGTEVVPEGLTTADTSGLAKTEYQLDGGTWKPAAPVDIAEGRHELRVRAFDAAGNAAPVAERIFTVDKSKPSARIASFPPRPNERGFFRQARQEQVAVSDGRDASGPDGATYQVDGGPVVSYLIPFSIGHGAHTVTVRARDRAGLQGDALVQSSKIDTRAPVPTVTKPAPNPILLPGQKSTLKWTAEDVIGTKVKVSVIVYDVLGTAVRRIDVPGPAPDDPYLSVGSQSTEWDGRKNNGKSVLPGTYYFRVQTTDEAGNTAISTESPLFLVTLPGL
jgi:hypothetical protein